MKMMKIFYPLVISIYLILSGATTYASDFEDTWYGFQKFLAKKDQTTWFFQCGFDNTDGVFVVTNNFKIGKEGKNLSFYNIGPSDSWQLMEATIGATTIEFNEQEQAVKYFHVDQYERLFRTFSAYLDGDRKTMRSGTFEEHFEIRNKLTVKDKINLSTGALDIWHGSSKEPLRVYAKDNTVLSRRNKIWITNREYQISSGVRYTCRSLKPF
jgi:hypothetical protein